MKIFFILLVLCMGFLTTPINGVRPLTSPAPAPTCSPTPPTPATKKLGSIGFGFFLLFFLMVSFGYSIYCITQAQQDVEGQVIVVREEVVELTSPEAKLMNFVQSARAALKDAEAELIKVLKSLKEEGGQQQQGQGAGAGEGAGAGAGEGEGEGEGAGAGGGDEIVAAQPAVVNSADQLHLMMVQFQKADNATGDLEAALVLNISVPLENPLLNKITRRKTKLDEHIERWSRRFEESREAEFLGKYGRPFSQGLKHAIPTLWAALKPFAVVYLCVKMFWPAVALFNGVPKWENVWNPI